MKVPQQPIKAIAHGWLRYLRQAPPWLASLCLLLTYPFPKVYVLVAHSATLATRSADRVWRIRRGPLTGFALTGLLPEEIAPVLTSTMENRCSSFLMQLPLKATTVLDVGGSYGYYALLLSALVGTHGRVFSFEPDWQSFERLTRNLALNNVVNGTAVPICLADTSGRLARWRSCSEEPWKSKLDDGAPDPSYQNSNSQSLVAVPVVSLDDFAAALDISDRVRFIKIDVEGSELMVLQGAERLLRQSRPLILCELHGADIAGQVFSFLGNHGYKWQMIEYMSDTRQHIFAFAENWDGFKDIASFLSEIR